MLNSPRKVNKSTLFYDLFVTLSSPWYRLKNSVPGFVFFEIKKKLIFVEKYFRIKTLIVVSAFFRQDVSFRMVYHVPKWLPSKIGTI